MVGAQDDTGIGHGLNTPNHSMSRQPKLRGGPEAVLDRNQESVSAGSSSSPVSPVSWDSGSTLAWSGSSY